MSYNLGDKDAIDMAKEKLDEIWEAIEARDPKKIQSGLQELHDLIDALEGIIAVHHS